MTIERERRPAGNRTASNPLVGDCDQGNGSVRQALIERGRAIVESGAHAPPPPQWTAVAERRHWGRDPEPAPVVDLAAYRAERGVPK
jgi:hypothetical protein